MSTAAVLVIALAVLSAWGAIALVVCRAFGRAASAAPWWETTGEEIAAMPASVLDAEGDEH